MNTLLFIASFIPLMLGIALMFKAFAIREQAKLLAGDSHKLLELQRREIIFLRSKIRNLTHPTEK